MSPYPPYERVCTHPLTAPECVRTHPLECVRTHPLCRVERFEASGLLLILQASRSYQHLSGVFAPTLLSLSARSPVVRRHWRPTVPEGHLARRSAPAGTASGWVGHSGASARLRTGLDAV